MGNPTTYMDERYAMRQGLIKIGLGNTGAITMNAAPDQRRVSTGIGNTGNLSVSAAGAVHSVMIAVSAAGVAVGDLIIASIGAGGDANRKLLAFGTYAATNSVNVRIFNTTASAIAVSAPIYVVAYPYAATALVTNSATSITISAAGAAVGDFVMATLGAGGDANHKVRVDTAAVVAANSVKVTLINTTGSAISISAPVFVWAFPKDMFVNQSGTPAASL